MSYGKTYVAIFVGNLSQRHKDITRSMSSMEDPRNLILERLQLGKTKYGHGVRVDDDTMTWGTKKDSWMHMAKEEFLDGIIYVIADYIRKGRESIKLMSYLEFRYMYTHDFIKSEDPRKWLEENRPEDDNGLILFILRRVHMIESTTHRHMVKSLINMLYFC